MLTEPTCSPIGAPTAWEPLTHNASNQATGGIWRVTGPGGTAILKHTTPGSGRTGDWAAGDDPRHWNYWKREYLAYTSGAVDHYCAAAELSAPALLAAGERDDGSVELWLEYIDGTPAQQWELDRLAAFAHQLGLAQARLADQPDRPWHSRRWLRQYAGRLDYPDILWDHPAAAAHWPTELRAGLRMVWERQADLFDLAERLPQTLCHLDVWPMNLTARGPAAVLLDWAFLGRGAVGEDLANLIADTFFDGLWPVDRLHATRRALTDAYLAGLAEAGWDRVDEARNAIAVTGAAKYVWLAPMMLTRLAAGQRTGSASYDPDSDDNAVFTRRRPIFEMIVAWARTALET